jgi:hypothetical protein
MTIQGSNMQSGASVTRTENQKKISTNKNTMQQNIQQQILIMNAHPSVSFTSASAEISSWHADV